MISHILNLIWVVLERRVELWQIPADMIHLREDVKKFIADKTIGRIKKIKQSKDMIPPKDGKPSQPAEDPYQIMIVSLLNDEIMTEI